jgi:membrane protease YdiL (CAAX protease family)
MLTSESISQSRNGTSHDSISQILIFSLLFIRILEGVVELVAYPDVMGLLVSMNFIYTIVTYLLTAILIWLEREALSDFHIGKLALIIFILSKPYQLLLQLLGFAPSSLITILVLVPIAIRLFWSLRKDDKLVLEYKANLSRWVLISTIIGIVLGVFSGYMLILQGGRGDKQLSLLLVIVIPTIQLTNAAVNEEPLFRGFLWGFLRKKGLRDIWIWMIQAGLFWLGHIGYLGRVDQPISFWIALIMGLIFGLIAWRARDIAPSMITHALVNGVGQIVSGY